MELGVHIPSSRSVPATHVSRYHPLLVTLHWVLAALIIATLTLGFFGLATTPNSDPQKIGVLRVHMAGGMLIFALMVIRFVARIRTLRPAHATTGYPLLDRIAPISNYGFYVVVVLMTGTGFTTGILTGLPAIVFSGSGPSLPPTFMIYPTCVAHRYIAVLLVSFIILHVLAVFHTNSSERMHCSGGCTSGGVWQISEE